MNSLEYERMLDDRFPHDANCYGCGGLCDCGRVFRMMEHIERLEAIAEAARHYRWCETDQAYKAPECSNPEMVDRARAVLDAALKANLGGGT